MRLSSALTGEPAGLLEDLLTTPKAATAAGSWAQARRTGQLKIGGLILAERAKSTWIFRLEIKRLREIEAIIELRHGRFVDTDDGYSYAEAVALSLAGQDLTAWCRYWTPLVDAAMVAQIGARADKRKRMLGADDCAALLCVTMAERTALDLRTIGACDVTKEERDAISLERKRQRDRDRQAARREADGRKSRAEYEAGSISRMKPWEAMGMSRATWHRKGKPMLETSPSRIEEHNTNSDTLVSLPKAPAVMAARTIIPALPITAAATTDNRLALGRAMGARGNLVPSHLLGGRK